MSKDLYDCEIEVTFKFGVYEIEDWVTAMAMAMRELKFAIPESWALERIVPVISIVEREEE